LEITDAYALENPDRQQQKIQNLLFLRMLLNTYIESVFWYLLLLMLSISDLTISEAEFQNLMAVQSKFDFTLL
jgi:hypothetical protein